VVLTAGMNGYGMAYFGERSQAVGRNSVSVLRLLATLDHDAEFGLMAEKKPTKKKPAAKSKKPTATAAAPNGGEQAASPQGVGETAFSEPTPGGQKTVANMMGEIVWLLTQSQAHKNFFLSDLEWLVMTPLMLQQFRVFYADDRPVGVALWAHVNEDVEKRLMAGNARLAPNDWKSGDRLWLVDLVAPFGGHDAMLQDLKSQVFQTQVFKYLGQEDGKAVVREM